MNDPATRLSLQGLADVLRSHPRDAWLAVLHGDQKARWARGQGVPAEGYLAEISELARDNELAVDLIYSEALVRASLGEAPDAEAYARRFPSHAAELRRQFLFRGAIGAASLSERASKDGRGTPHPGLEGRSDPDSTTSSDLALLSHTEVPATIGRFPILRMLGQGGFGIVYLAHDEACDREVALKVPRPEALLSHQMRQRFLREAEIAAELDHPNLVPVYEAGEAGAICYIASAYCPGVTLAEWLRTHPELMEPRQAALLVATLADATAHAHQRGVIHRDLKPANVLLQQPENPGDTGLGVPRVCDFGLAKSLGGVELTCTGTVLGSPEYMAPEQAAGRIRDISTQSDVYALGVILYECLTGRVPFRDEIREGVLHRVLNEQPLDFGKLRPGLSRNLGAVCLKCLEKEPKRRYSSAEEFARDLRRYLDGLPTLARPLPLWGRAVLWARRQPALAALVFLTGLAAVGGVAGLLWHDHIQRGTLADLGQALSVSDRLRSEGKSREAHLREALYVADVRQAKQAWERGDLAEARALLDRHQPEGEEEDLRGFEWHWLWRCCHPERHSFRAHPGGLLCAATSPDGRLLVIGDCKGSVEVRFLATKRLVAALVGHTDEVQRACFSRDGLTLATCSKDRTILLWDVATWKQKACLRGHTMTVTSVAFSPDGTRLASCDRAHRLTLWELPGGRELRSWEGHTYVVHDVGFTPDGLSLISVSKDGWAKVWEVNTGRELRKFSHQDTLPPLRLAIDPSGQTLATGGYGGGVRLWSLSGPPGPFVLDTDSPVRSLAFSPDGSSLAAVEGNASLSVWGLHPHGGGVAWHRGITLGSQGGSAARHGGAAVPDDTVREVLFPGGPSALVVAHEEGTVRILKTKWLRGSWTLLTSSRADPWFAVSGDGSRLAWPTHNFQSKVFDLERLQTVATHNRPREARERVVSVSPSVQHLTIDEAETLHVFDTFTGQELSAQRVGIGGVHLLVLAPADHLLAAGFKDGTVRVWEHPTGQALAAFQVDSQGLVGLTFTDGNTVAVMSSDGTVTLWNPRSGHRIRTLGRLERGNGYLAATADGCVLAAGSHDGQIKTWDLRSGQELWAAHAHRREVADLTFTPDGRTLASAGVEGTLKLWHVSTGQELIAVPTNRIGRLAFASDGRCLFASTNTAPGGAILSWPADPPDNK